MLILTESAVKAVSNFISSAEGPVTGLRISVTGGGCSGMQYGMSLEAASEESDTIVEFGEVKVYVDPESAPMLEGVTVDFLDSRDLTVGKAEAEAAELPEGTRLDLQASLSSEAVRLRIYSVQWRMDGTAALMGPFREPWEFGYLMVDAARIDR